MIVEKGTRYVLDIIVLLVMNGCISEQANVLHSLCPMEVQWNKYYGTVKGSTENSPICFDLHFHSLTKYLLHCSITLH